LIRKIKHDFVEILAFIQVRNFTKLSAVSTNLIVFFSKAFTFKLVAEVLLTEAYNV